MTASNQLQDTIARILWRERKYELETAETFAPGLLARTDLALLFKDAADEYAKYEAETVTPEQLEQQLQGMKEDVDYEDAKERENE